MSCLDGHGVGPLDPGEYTFYVRATDLAGNTDTLDQPVTITGCAARCVARFEVPALPFWSLFD